MMCSFVQTTKIINDAVLVVYFSKKSNKFHKTRIEYHRDSYIFLYSLWSDEVEYLKDYFRSLVVHNFHKRFGSWDQGKGYFAECGLRNAESCQRVICGKFDADFFFCGMKGKVRNESMRNVTEMNID